MEEVEKKRNIWREKKWLVHQTFSLVTCVTSATNNLLRYLHDTNLKWGTHIFLSFKDEQKIKTDERKTCLNCKKKEGEGQI